MLRWPSFVLVSGSFHPLRIARKTPEQGGRMLRPENRRPWVPKTAELTLTAGLAAIYVITTYLPLSKFIGGPVFITLEIVMLPIIAALLRPPLSLAAAF